MALLEWKEDFSVHIKQFDNQHKKLVSLINELHSAMLQAKGKEVLGKILNDLSDYTFYHFSSEEKIMLEYSYPGYVMHKAEHDKLTKQVAELIENQKSGKQVLSQEVMSFLKKWLVEHISVSDKKYSTYLNNKGVN